MNALYACLTGLLLLLSSRDHNVQGQGPHEPSCTSSFDYEHKVMHTILKLEIEQESQAKQIAAILHEAETEAANHRDEIQRLREDVEAKVADIRALTERVHELETNLSTVSGQTESAAGYTFKDGLAQATCTALGTRHVYAVRRLCSNIAASCDATCKTLGFTCIDSLHVYDRGALTLDDVSKTGLSTYRYKSCGGNFCGPNFCCCTGN